MLKSINGGKSAEVVKILLPHAVIIQTLFVAAAAAAGDGRAIKRASSKGHSFKRQQPRQQLGQQQQLRLLPSGPKLRGGKAATGDTRRREREGKG